MVHDGKAQERIQKIRKIDALRAKGLSAKKAVRQAGISEPTYYGWKRELGMRAAANMPKVQAQRNRVPLLVAREVHETGGDGALKIETLAGQFEETVKAIREQPEHFLAALLEAQVKQAQP